MSAPPCTSVGSLVPVPLCYGSFPAGMKREVNPSGVDGSAGGRSVGDDGGRRRVRGYVVGEG